jgi:hypothetical protein
MRPDHAVCKQTQAACLIGRPLKLLCQMVQRRTYRRANAVGAARLLPQWNRRRLRKARGFAVRAYQSLVGAEPDGRLDLDTLSSFGFLPAQQTPGFAPPWRRLHAPMVEPTHPSRG